MSMAHSIETRVPLLDRELVDFCAKLPPNIKQKKSENKYIFKKAMEPYLPYDVIYRPKSGFGLPIRHWISNELEDLVNITLNKKTLDQHQIFNYEKTKNIIALNKKGTIDASYLIFAMMTITWWASKL